MRKCIITVTIPVPDDTRQGAVIRGLGAEAEALDVAVQKAGGTLTAATVRRSDKRAAKAASGA